MRQSLNVLRIAIASFLLIAGPLAHSLIIFCTGLIVLFTVETKGDEK